MGCAASKKAVDPVDPGPGPPPHLFGASKKPVDPRPAKPLAPMTPEAQAAAQARTVRLLESLAAKEERVDAGVLDGR